ncbi:MAG TPA: hypothetical protein VGU71_15815, partial [Candidatus Dormibacteraeota bacterium]|nr:hypothetical protein [Candidatus Dormibacteraeota bacterium]
DLYMDSDWSSYVLAMRLRGTLYAGDLYLHPEHQYWGMIYSGAPIALVSGAALVLFAWGIVWLRRRRAKDQAAGAPSPSS